MFKTTAILLAAVLALSACAGETPIRKTNCWNTMAFTSADGADCEFQYVPVR